MICNCAPHLCEMMLNNLFNSSSMPSKSLKRAKGNKIREPILQFIVLWLSRRNVVSTPRQPYKERALTRPLTQFNTNYNIRYI